MVQQIVSLPIAHLVNMIPRNKGAPSVEAAAPKAKTSLSSTPEAATEKSADNQAFNMDAPSDAEMAELLSQYSAGPGKKTKLQSPA